MTERSVPMHLYSQALDEIHALRRALAYEAEITAGHLGYRSFPKTRRHIAEDQIERMREAARGQVTTAYAGRPTRSLDRAMREAGAPTTLTRQQWEAGLRKWEAERRRRP